MTAYIFDRWGRKRDIPVPDSLMVEHRNLQGGVSARRVTCDSEGNLPVQYQTEELVKPEGWSPLMALSAEEVSKYGTPEQIKAYQDALAALPIKVRKWKLVRKRFGAVHSPASEVPFYMEF